MFAYEYIITFGLFVAVIYFWLTKDHGYWKKRGVPFKKPRLIVGNMGSVIFKNGSFGHYFRDKYREYEGYPYVGIFNLRKPVLLVRDLDIINDVLVKEFSKFHDIPFDLDENLDPIISKNPFFSKGEKWKIARSQIIPFLTVNKMKTMFPLVQETSKKMVKYLNEEPKAASSEGLEAKELAMKFTVDNVASCAFGIEGNSFTNPNAEFRKLAEKFFNFSLVGVIKFFLTFIFPEVAKLIKVSFADKEVCDKFKAIITETIEYRQKNKVVRKDFLDSVIELKSKPLPYEYTIDHIVAHAMTFFLDGSETSAIVYSFGIFELAANPDIQTKLKNEIDTVLAKHDGMLTFEAIQEMSYLEAVFLETLRLYPPLMVMNRECTEACTLSQTDSSGTLKTVSVDKGTEIAIPVFALHRDSKHYYDPERFDPNRFTDEAKHPLPKNCFFGFGDGPRTCIGRRFANMQIKAGLIALVSNFEIRVNNKTKLPLDISGKTTLLAAKDGIWVNFYKRNKD